MRWWLVAVVCACGSAVRIPAKSTISIVDRGAEPRQLLRYTPVPATSERAEITIKQRMRTAYTNTVLEEGRQDVDLPSLRLIGPIVIENVSADGALLTFMIEESIVLDDLVDPRARAQIAAIASLLAQKRVSWRRAPNGALSAFDVPAEAADAITELRFPDEPVGIGASWQITSAFAASGIRFRSTTTYRVRDLTPTQVTLDFEAELVAPEQSPSTEPNASVHVKSAHGRSTGHAVIPLGSAVPNVSARLTLEANVLITRGRLRITATRTTENIVEMKRVP